MRKTLPSPPELIEPILREELGDAAPAMVVHLHQWWAVVSAKPWRSTAATAVRRIVECRQNDENPPPFCSSAAIAWVSDLALRNGMSRSTSFVWARLMKGLLGSLHGDRRGFQCDRIFHSNGSRRVLPLDRHLVARIIRAADPTSLADVRDVALLLVSYQTASHASELVSGAGRAPCVEDLARSANGTGRLRLLRIDRYAQQERRVTCTLCSLAMTWIDAWLRLSGITEGPLFRQIVGEGRRVTERAVSKRELQIALKRLAKQAGIDPTFVRCDSPKLGLSSDAAREGVALADSLRAGQIVFEEIRTMIELPEDRALLETLQRVVRRHGSPAPAPVPRTFAGGAARQLLLLN